MVSRDRVGAGLLWNRLISYMYMQGIIRKLSIDTKKTGFLPDLLLDLPVYHLRPECWNYKLCIS